jgi:hypothetical protein
MISHNSLQDRLTAVRDGKPIPKPPMSQKVEIKPSNAPQASTVTYKQFFISEGYKLFNVMATSALYGFGIKTIFSQTWDFIGILGVGFLLNHFLTIILKSKLFKR